MVPISLEITDATFESRGDEFLYVVDDASHRVSYILAEHFEDPRKAKRVLKRLGASEVMASADVAAIPATTVELLHMQEYGGAYPDWEKLADELKVRWTAAETKSVRIYYASRKTLLRLGGDMPGHLKQLDAISHDLGLTSVFMELTRACPLLRNAWVPETRIPEAYGMVHPDALIADASGPKVLLEFCGRYSADRLQRLSKYAELQRLPIQFWTIAREGKR